MFASQNKLRGAGAVALALCASDVSAECRTGETAFLSCQIAQSENRLNVCFVRDRVFYEFGPEGAPDLTLDVSLAEADYRPWPGVGRAIWESMTFYNGDYVYETWGAIDRFPDPIDPDAVAVETRGGVTVIRDEKILTALECESGTVDFAYIDALSRAKEALGYSWNSADFEWVELPD